MTGPEPKMKMIDGELHSQCPTLRVCRKDMRGCGTTYSQSIWGLKRKCNGCGGRLYGGYFD